MAINQNIEYATLLRCTAELNSEISADPTSISTRLLAQGFIPQLPPHSSPTAEDVVKQVTTKVKTFPNYFEAFISILSEFPWLQDIVKLIRKTYNELKLGQQVISKKKKKKKGLLFFCIRGNYKMEQLHHIYLNAV